MLTEHLPQLYYVNLPFSSQVYSVTHKTNDFFDLVEKLYFKAIIPI